MPVASRSLLMLGTALALSLCTAGLAVAPLAAGGADDAPVVAAGKPAMAAGTGDGSAPAIVTERLGVVYGSATNAAGVREDLALDLFLPPSGDGPRTAVVLAHGGAFRAGSRKHPQIRHLARSLAEHGYVAASISYRLQPPGTPGAQRRGDLLRDDIAHRSGASRDAQHDFQAAVRYLRAHADALRINPGRIAAMGSSAGGITALEVAFNPEDAGASGNPGHRSDVAAVIALWGASHHSRIEAGAPPALMVHGTEDATVPFALGVQTCAATRLRGNVCEPLWLQDAGHAAWDHRDDIMAATLDFLAQHVD